LVRRPTTTWGGLKLMKMDWLLKNILLPSDYKNQINELDV